MYGSFFFSSGHIKLTAALNQTLAAQYNTYPYQGLGGGASKKSSIHLLVQAIALMAVDVNNYSALGFQRAGTECVEL